MKHRIKIKADGTFHWYFGSWLPGHHGDPARPVQIWVGPYQTLAGAYWEAEHTRKEMAR